MSPSISNQTPYSFWWPKPASTTRSQTSRATPATIWRLVPDSAKVEIWACPPAVAMPPRQLNCSMMSVRMPLRAEPSAAATPAGPPPTTMTSYSPDTGTCRDGSVTVFAMTSPVLPRTTVVNHNDTTSTTRESI